MTLGKLLIRCCLMGALALVASVSNAGGKSKPSTLETILKMQETTARNERMSSAKPSNLSARGLAVTAANSGSCTIGGGHCSFDSECCSDNCYSNTCQAGSGSCTIGGGHCSFDSDCCSDNCYANECQAGTSKCSDGGAHCSFDSECCSGNCYSNVCQAACTSTGDACTYDHECCGGNCNSIGRCGGEPTDPRCP